MKRGDFSSLPKKTLLALLEGCARNLLSVDGLWFLGVEEDHGTEKATEIDLKVWQQFGRIEANRLKRALNLQGDGLPLLFQAFHWNPTLRAFAEYDLSLLNDGLADLKITFCRPQSTRLEKGLGLFQCEEVERAYFSSFATTLDPRIKVGCVSCPPRQYSPNLWCEWHFTLNEGG